MDFRQLGLSDKVCAAVEEVGYKEATPIQAEAIPAVIDRRDVLGIAQTGTGKTASFVLPMLTLLEKGRARARMPRSLILAPTRELAVQVLDNLKVYGSKQNKINIALLIGGVSFNEQDAIINKGADILIATPGRLLDHIERGKLMLNAVELFVIDEADRMLDMGFIPDVEAIYKRLPVTRQTLFFSATMPPEIQRITNIFLHNPKRIEIARQSSAADTIEQQFYHVSSDEKVKRETLRQLINKQDINNAIIFCNRKRNVKLLEASFSKHGFNVMAIHGDLDQRSRLEAISKFKDGEVSILVASDIAARGLDIPTVSHVFNFEIPINSEDYIHRIGRTGRAGRTGVAISLVSKNEMKSVDDIVKLTGQDINWQNSIEDVKTTTEFKAKNKRSKSRRQSKINNNEPYIDSNDSEETIIGMGDHIPDFLLLPVKIDSNHR